MKNTFLLFTLILLLGSCRDGSSNKSRAVDTTQTDRVAPQIIEVASFKGQQVTGVTVSNSGRIFVNFPEMEKRCYQFCS
ncbi:hypothetical protein [Lacinutrix neustonica]|uniref:hypothetical protein n=1 Tax=Lacinutrix neustonica TaxID=2980107 RepID=UPI0028BEBCA7|nr:hypothetical protein [Lacinutrix neustonica]